MDAIGGLRRTLGEGLRRNWRATGAELPGGDLVAARGVSMDGWFWRISDPASGRVALALAGLNTPRQGEPWGIVGIAADPARSLTTATLSSVAGDERGLRVSMRGDEGHFRATRESLQARLGSTSLELRFDRLDEWQGRLGGSDVFGMVPRLNQYWHPWVLGGSASGVFDDGSTRWEFDDAQVYAEKNWGRGGFPVQWWWGQAQGFAEPTACVAFGGGRIHLGRPGRDARLSTTVTALVVRTPDGEQLRFGNPGTSPVVATVGDGHWRLRGRRRGWRVEVDAAAPLEEAFVLPVPLVEERALAPGAVEAQLGHLEVRLFRDGRPYWQGISNLAALEDGGRELAEAQLAQRAGNPLPRRD
ncbi:tocopherol cyclase family protein [Luteococcus sp.]|uniref:tocopherol cyclase family protein n=1 Tax=Luteococcus sp. TaxID=1969402 RepID=UPI003735B9EC